MVVSSFDAGQHRGRPQRPTPGLPVGWLLEWTADAADRARAEAVERGYQALHPFVTQVDGPLVAQAPRRRAGRPRLDGQRRRRPPGHGRAGRGRGHHRPAGGGAGLARPAERSRRPGRPRRPGGMAAPGSGSEQCSDHERRRLCQADPRSGGPAVAGSHHPHPRPVGQAHPRRLRLLRRRDGPPAGRERRGQRGDPGLDGARRGDLGPAHRPGHGGGQGHPGQRRRPGRLRRPGHGQGAGRRHPAGRARPGDRGHRVDRRLHRHPAGAGGRAAGPALGHLRQERVDRRHRPSRSSARPRPATTRWSARCRPWSR